MGKVLQPIIDDSNRAKSGEGYKMKPLQTHFIICWDLIRLIYKYLPGKQEGVPVDP